MNSLTYINWISMLILTLELIPPNPIITTTTQT
jgi:hypothetical protein